MALSHLRVVLLAGLAFCYMQPAWAQEGEHDHGAAEFGIVRFPTTCGPAVQPKFERAVAMLHSFFYPETVKAFEQVVATDPNCAMGWWGLSVSQRPNPLVPPWPPENLKRAADAIQRGKAVAETQRERDWLNAAEAAFAGYDTVPTQVRSERYEQAMSQLAVKYPQDTEAQIFYALALLEAVDLRDKTYARQIKAGEILERISREQPGHPGLAHYIVHAYDFEPLAERGLAAADRYAALAPLAPHAQHMPSHIYSMLGRWQDSIRSNKRALEASRAYAAQNAPGTTFSQEPHAQDFLAYAYLQLGQDRKVERVIGELAAVRTFSGARNYARDTGMIAPAVRSVLERQAWTEALALPVRPDLYTYAQAMPRFARAVGAANLGQVDIARAEIEQLTALGGKAESAYWRGQIELLQLAAAAWLSLSEGRHDEALQRMRNAVERENGSEKNVAMENRLYPMGEMLGDMLMKMGQTRDALVAYETSLRTMPNRLHGFVGAARAARAEGDPAKARAYFEKLVILGQDADPERAEIVEARAFLDSQH